jgi:hypothetical protein
MRRGLCVFWFMSACTGEVEGLVGAFEPVRVPDGEFIEDELPARDDGPTVTSIEAASGILTVGQRGRLLAGRTAADAHAIALRLDGLGEGWWVRPVQDIDPMFPGERVFQLAYDVGGGAPPGRHRLLLAAVDEGGRRGPAFPLEVCVRDDRVPDNLNACDPTIAPPALVVALQWDRPVDLDLVLEVPGGKRVGHAAPTSGSKDGNAVPKEAINDPSVGRLTRDSNAGCALDGRNSEAVVFQEPPAPGTYLVYADLFDACGEPGALFDVVVYRRREQPDGTLALAEVSRTGGGVLDLQAGGGAGAPLFVTAFEQP